MATTAKDIAALRRQMRETNNNVLKTALKKKISRLEEDMKSQKMTAKQLATSLFKARTEIDGMNKSQFSSLIKRLSAKPEYSFLKGMTKGQVKDDLERPAKPVGWRFKGNLTRKPTAAEVKAGKRNGTVYYENRRRHSDVVRSVQLAKGGGVGGGDMFDGYKDLAGLYEKWNDSEKNFKKDGGAEYERLSKEIENAKKQNRSKYFEALNNAERNFKKDGGAEYNRLESMRNKFAKGGGVGISDLVIGNDYAIVDFGMGYWLNDWTFKGERKPNEYVFTSSKQFDNSEQVFTKDELLGYIKDGAIIENENVDDFEEFSQYAKGGGVETKKIKWEPSKNKKAEGFVSKSFPHSAKGDMLLTEAEFVKKWSRRIESWIGIKPNLSNVETFFPDYSMDFKFTGSDGNSYRIYSPGESAKSKQYIIQKLKANIQMATGGGVGFNSWSEVEKYENEVRDILLKEYNEDYEEAINNFVENSSYLEIGLGENWSAEKTASKFIISEWDDNDDSYAKGGGLKPIPSDNKGLPKLPQSVRNKMGYMKTGGGVGDVNEENRDMVMNNNNQIMHHANELKEAVKKAKHIPAWVVAKVFEASSALSNVTHYLDGTTKMATGGSVGNKKFEAEEDGVLGIYSGSEAYSLEISKGDIFETVGKQDSEYWWFVKKVNETPMRYNMRNQFNERKNKDNVNIDFDELILTFPKGKEKGRYAKMKEIMATGGSLKGNQNKLDMNKNGRLDAEDFKILRGKK
jgi:hypothetical protein